MPTAKPSNKLIIAGKEFELDWPLYNFHEEDPGYNAYLETCSKHGACGPGGMPRSPAKGITKLTRYRPRRITEKTLSAAQAVIKQFVVHLDGCDKAETCFDVLQNERGLSVHFIVDNDGTIYQTLDLIDCAYHACGLNETSIGVEICNRGDARKDPDYYKRLGPGMADGRDIVACTVHNEKYLAFDFTPKQYEGMQHLSKALAKLLPNLKQDFPRNPSNPGQVLWTTPYTAAEDPNNKILADKFSGYVGHYHLTNQKWDPGPWDWNKFLGKVQGQRSFPIGLHGLAAKEQGADPKAPPSASIPDDPASLKKAVDAFYDNNEQGAGGFFPIGPFEGNRLYHNGVHLHGDEGANVVAPLPGKVVAARQAPLANGIGSINFVLIHHNTSVGRESLDYFSLYMHLAVEAVPKKRADRLKWMQSPEWDETSPSVQVFNSPEPVAAGDVIGHIGKAGPDDPQPQLHFAIFAAEHGPVERLDKDHFWNVVDGSNNRRYCNQPAIIGPIDIGKKDKQISDDELADFFHNGDREQMHHVVTLDYSEWALQPDWALALEAPDTEPKWKKLKPKEVQDLVDEQITPLLWWTDDIAQRLKLPASAIVYHYHPISFLGWLAAKTATKEGGGNAITKVDAASFEREKASATGTAQLDIDDVSGKSFVSDDDLIVVPEAQKLNLENIIDGYGD